MKYNAKERDGPPDAQVLPLLKALTLREVGPREPLIKMNAEQKFKETHRRSSEKVKWHLRRLHENMDYLKESAPGYKFEEDMLAHRIFQGAG